MTKLKVFKTLFFGSFFLIATIVVAWNVLSPGVVHPPEKVESIKDVLAYVEEMVADETPPSLNITIIKNGNVVFNEGFGTADRFNKIKTNKETVYHLWSQTKLLTAVAIFKLIEQKKLTLDTEVSSLLPYFSPVGGDQKTYKVTVAQLLNHSSGLHDFIYNGGMGMVHLHGEPSINQTELLKKILIDNNKLHFIPGTDSSYTNTGYIVLGAIIEKLSGISYEKYIEDKITSPLGLKNASFVYNDEMLNNAALGTLAVVDVFTPIVVKSIPNWFEKYVVDTQDLRMWMRHLYTDYTPSTGLIGSSHDMALFGQMMLNGGELNGVRIISKDSADTLLYKGHREEDKLEPKLGLGFKTWTIDENVMIGHGGGGPGFGSQLMINKKRNLIISIAANDTNVDRFNLMKVLFKLDW